MKQIILRVYDKIANRYREIVIWLVYIKVAIFPNSIISIAPIVRSVVEDTNKMEGLLSNEYRHAHTYATLRKRLPNVPSRDIGLCIELVIYGIL